MAVGEQAQAGPSSMGAKAPLGSGLPAWSDPQSDPCAACGVCRYTFEPPSIFCTSCSQRIKRNQVSRPAVLKTPFFACHRVLLKYLVCVHSPLHVM